MSDNRSLYYYVRSILVCFCIIMPIASNWAYASGTHALDNKSNQKIVYFGGIGWASKGKDGQSQRYIKELVAKGLTQRDIIPSIFESLSGKYLSGSSYPIILTQQGYAPIINDLGLSDEFDYVSSGKYIFTKFYATGGIYSLVLIASMEKHAKYLFQSFGNKNYHENMLVGVNAVIVDVKTNTILTSASAIAEARKSNSDGYLPHNAVLRIFSEVYGRAAKRALERLNALDAKPSAQTYIVTSVLVEDPLVRQMFNIQRGSPSINWPFNYSSGCMKSDRECNEFMAFVTNSATARLSALGLNTIPSTQYSSWKSGVSEALLAKFEISGEDRLPGFDGLHVLEAIGLSSNPKEYMGMKVKTVIDRVDERNKKQKNKYLSERVFGAKVHFEWKDTELNKIQKKGRLKAVKSVSGSIIRSKQEENLSLPLDVKKVLFMMAIKNAIGQTVTP